MSSAHITVLLAALTLVAGCPDWGRRGVDGGAPSGTGGSYEPPTRDAGPQATAGQGGDTPTPSIDAGPPEPCSDLDCLVPACTPCGATECCDGSVCVESCDGAHTCEPAACFADDECSTGCCVLDECQAPWACDSRACETDACFGCPDAIVLAVDGTFLGNASFDETVDDGVCNPTSRYGISGADGIFDFDNPYGSETGAASAYNPESESPPQLVCRTTNRVMGTITRNPMHAHLQSIDPDDLCIWLQNNLCE